MQTIIVDPSRTVQKIVGQLVEAAGHRVSTFSDGREALDYLRANSNVEAVITSVELPTISGIELCRMVRELSSSHRPIYIMVMSSSAQQDRLVRALEGGADDYISKPPSTEELCARLRAAERLGSMQRELVRLAMTDPLTALLNRRAFFERAVELCANACTGKALAAVMFDIDHFKRINDMYGHGTGDRVIRAVAKTAASIDGLIGRLGGEEFAILVVDHTMEDVLALAEKLRSEITTLELETQGTIVKFTLSLGVADWKAGDTIDSLLRRADHALYRAKANGRDCVVAYQPSFGEMPSSSVTRSKDRRPG